MYVFVCVIVCMYVSVYSSSLLNFSSRLLLFFFCLRVISVSGKFILFSSFLERENNSLALADLGFSSKDISRNGGLYYILTWLSEASFDGPSFHSSMTSVLNSIGLMSEVDMLFHSRNPFFILQQFLWVSVSRIRQLTRRPNGFHATFIQHMRFLLYILLFK